MNRRIHYILIIFTFQMFQVNLYSQGSWESVESPTNQFLTSVYFVDSLFGWAVGDSGTIIHTTNGGTDWSFQNSKTENKIVEVFFLNRELGWASSWNTSSIPFGTIILKTTDGGQSWKSELYQDENLFMTTILFLDSLNGWMGGKPHALVKTTNGGLSWLQADIDTSIFAFFPISSINFYNSQYGYACGGSFENVGLIWRTTNGGNKWLVILVFMIFFGLIPGVDPGIPGSAHAVRESQTESAKPRADHPRHWRRAPDFDGFGLSLWSGRRRGLRPWRPGP